MPEGVVDELEAVEVQEQDGPLLLSESLGALERQLDLLAEATPVELSGQRVVVGEVLQLPFELLAVRDVHHVRHRHLDRPAVLGGAHGSSASTRSPRLICARISVSSSRRSGGSNPAITPQAVKVSNTIPTPVP